MKTFKFSILSAFIALLTFACTEEDEPFVIPVVNVPTSSVVVDADNVYPNQVSYFFAGKYWHLASTASYWYSTQGETKLYSSEDGVTWVDVTDSSTFATMDASSYHSVAVYNDKVYLIAPTSLTDGWGSFYSNYSSDVYSSEDGLTFALASEDFPVAGADFDVYVLGDKIIATNGQSLSYGRYSTVSKPIGTSFFGPGKNSIPSVSSTDGSSWVAGTDTIDERFARYAAPVVLDGVLYQIGGMKSTYTMDTTIVDEDTTIVGTCLSADVWKSEDNGLTWEVMENVLPTARFGAAAVAFGGKIWLFGGQTTLDQTISEILVSSDGASWDVTTQITLPAEYEGRAGHSLVLNDDELLIVGGYKAKADSTSTSICDVWPIDISTLK